MKEEQWRRYLYVVLLLEARDPDERLALRVHGQRPARGAHHDDTVLRAEVVVWPHTILLLIYQYLNAFSSYTMRKIYHNYIFAP